MKFRNLCLVHSVIVPDKCVVTSARQLYKLLYAAGSNKLCSTITVIGTYSCGILLA